MTEHRDHSSGGDPDKNWLSGLVKPEDGEREAQHWLQGLVKKSQDPVEERRESEKTEALAEYSDGTWADDAVEVEDRETEPEFEPGSEEPLERSTIRVGEPQFQPPQVLPKPEAKRPETAEPRSVPKRSSHVVPPPLSPERTATKLNPAVLVAEKARQKSRQEPESKRRELDSQLVLRASDLQDRAVLYKAMANMLEAGISVVGVFEFLAEQCENKLMGEACRRTAQGLASGHPFHIVAQAERRLFSPSTAKMLEVGLKSGQLVRILQRVADDENARWQLRQRIFGKMLYPLVLALVALTAALLLPPMVLSGILEEVVALSSEPPALTLALVKFSSALSSPYTITLVVCGFILTLFLLSRSQVRDKILECEKYAWRVPVIGPVLQTTASIRFLQLFAMNYEVGLPVTQALKLAAEASDSRVVASRGARITTLLIEGEGLYESIHSANFLSSIACEAIRAGDEVGRIPQMMRKAADILSAELEYRIEAALSVMEPILLLTLGLGVGVFAIGCLLPILKLAETL